MKEKLFRWVVKHRKPIIAFYAVAALVCLFLRQFVGVNYDITSYLPDEAASTVALNTMGDEFEGDIPNCRVMVPNVSIAQALKYKDKRRYEKAIGVASPAAQLLSAGSGCHNGL